MDENGRFAFYAVAPGNYGLTADLPDELAANIGPVVQPRNRSARRGFGCTCRWDCQAVTDSFASRQQLYMSVFENFIVYCQ